jgi:hypothetical protein
MGVTVDQPGENGAAAGVFDSESCEGGGNLTGATDPRDAIAVPGNRRIADGMDVGLAPADTTGGEKSDVREERQFPIPRG